MSITDVSAASQEKELPRWDRSEAALTLLAYEQRPAGVSQRQFARDKDVPRSTLQHWKARKDGLDADPLVVQFLESPQGLAFVHRLVAAMHLVFGQLGPCGVRLLSLFLLLSGLDRVVGASRGSQHKVAVQIEELIGEFGRSEGERLAATMEPKTISAAEDETFHRGKICLVGIEPVSGFVLLEQYSARRDAASWTEALSQAIRGLKVKVVQVLSDQAKGLLAHARERLGVHHGPDLFHVQHDLCKATALSLGRGVERAEKRLEEARAEVQRHSEQPPSDSCNPETATPSEPPSPRLTSAREAEEQATRALDEAKMLRSETQQAIRAIGQSYHPVRLEDGRVRSPEELEEELTEQFDRIEGAALLGELSQQSFERIEKPRRLIGSMVATLSFFWMSLRLAFSELELDEQLHCLVEQSLFPGLYIQSVAERAPGAERRRELRSKAEELLAVARDPGGPLSVLPEERRTRIVESTQRCVELFQRSSSCVEGRNGQLALRHHSLHRLTDRKLAVLRTIHNYFLRRPDGTTAAERFFGSKPLDLFEWILDRLDLPARPAKQRPRKVHKLL